MLFYTKEIITLKHNRVTSCETLCSHSMGVVGGVGKVGWIKRIMTSGCYLAKNSHTHTHSPLTEYTYMHYIRRKKSAYNSNKYKLVKIH